MRILFIGDIVGRSGRAVVLERLPGLIHDWKLDFVVINGENSAGGFGITEAIYLELVDAGADAITGGNHSWDQKEALVFIERAPKLLRPINYPAGTPGRGVALIEARNGARVLIVNAMGRIFMDALDDPFAAVERELAACSLKQAADAIIIDIHGEATSEKQAMGHFCDGRVSLVIGTHTHAPTEARNGARVLIVNAMGRIFMDALDDPFAAVERELAACSLKQAADAIIIDIHGEATSEKQAMGHFCDGRVSLVIGTHTHAPT